MSYRKRIVATLIVSTVAASAVAGDRKETAQSPAPKHLPAAYCLYDIGRLQGLPPGERAIKVEAINNRNQAVGWITISGAHLPLRGFIWDRMNGMRDLGEVPSLPSLQPTDISDAGTIVGDASNLDSGDGQPVIKRVGADIQVLDASLGGLRGAATGINRSGQIVGGSDISPDSSVVHAFLRDVDGDVLDLGVFPGGDGTSIARAINNRGWVVGTSNGLFSSEGFIWDERRGMRRLLENAGTMSTFAADINDRGEVVGETLDEQSRAFRWTRKEGLQDIGTLSSGEYRYATATSINDRGHIVGASTIDTTGAAHAFIWSRRSGMLDLNERVDPSSALASVAVLVIAQSINELGWIAVDGYVTNDAADPARSFVLTPRRRQTDACL